VPVSALSAAIDVGVITAADPSPRAVRADDALARSVKFEAFCAAVSALSRETWTGAASDVFGIDPAVSNTNGPRTTGRPARHAATTADTTVPSTAVTVGVTDPLSAQYTTNADPAVTVRGNRTRDVRPSSMYAAVALVASSPVRTTGAVPAETVIRPAMGASLPV
jgi:hypothetical protein